MGSLCDSCWSPGHCCNDIILLDQNGGVTFWADEGEEGVQRWLDDRRYPFKIKSKAEFKTDDGRAYWQVWFGCKWLGENGRCRGYDDRPDICRRYEPKSCSLCIMCTGESGDGSAEYHMTRGYRPTPGDFTLPDE